MAQNSYSQVHIGHFLLHLLYSILNLHKRCVISHIVTMFTDASLQNHTNYSPILL